jgi:hypothetical protein
MIRVALKYIEGSDDMAALFVILCLAGLFFLGYILMGKMENHPKQDPTKDAFYDDEFPIRPQDHLK